MNPKKEIIYMIKTLIKDYIKIKLKNFNQEFYITDQNKPSLFHQKPNIYLKIKNLLKNCLNIFLCILYQECLNYQLKDQYFQN